MGESTIEDLWNKLEPKTQEWLRANPGILILPRSVTATLLQASDHAGALEGVDRNGQFTLSAEDRFFLRSAAFSAPVGHPVPPGAPSG